MLQREAKKTLASQMQHYVYIQTKTSAADGEGGFVETWATTSSAIAASISPIQARQIAEYKSVNIDATHLIRMRGATTINDGGTYRILYGTRVFEILTVEDLQERGIEKVVTCKEAR